MKCIACKAENCKVAFQKYRNHTTFSALERSIEPIYDFTTEVLKGEFTEKISGKLCLNHIDTFVDWFYSFDDYVKSISNGVMLRTVNNSGNKSIK